MSSCPFQASRLVAGNHFTRLCFYSIFQSPNSGLNLSILGSGNLPNLSSLAMILDSAGSSVPASFFLQLSSPYILPNQASNV